MTKTVLLAITFFIIGNLVVIGLGIANASEQAKVSARKKMKAVVEYLVDWEAINKYVMSLETEEEQNNFYNNEYPYVKRDDVLKMMEGNDHIIAVNLMIKQTAYAMDFDVVELQNQDNNGSITYDTDVQVSTVDETTYVEPDIFISANAFEKMIEFEDGTYTLLEGRMYTEQDIIDGNNVVLIETGLAELNNLRVGDKITISYMTDYDLSWDAGLKEAFANYERNYEYEIIGIYDNKEVLDPNAEDYNWKSDFEAPENRILMPTSTVYTAIGPITAIYNEYWNKSNVSELEPRAIVITDLPSIDQFYYSNTVFLLDDPLEVQSFVDDNSANLPQFFKLDAHNEEFKNIARPLDSITIYTNIFMGIILVAATVIISLITALTLKNREFEIGILLAVGVSKVKVILQMFAEVFIIAILAFLLSIGSGSFLTKATGNWIRDFQLQFESQYGDTSDDLYGIAYYTSAWDTDYFSDITQDELMEGYDASVNPKVIAYTMGVGVLVVLIATVIPSILIMRYNPKRILTNVN
ncbi:MAG: ABC transporter permease [Erysipelotrichaceae bacterium]|jgi:ABC-type antimicrobial peptide transport system permease subunit|nr:ABC transporter permease [Erysipelotrichaceae bacterium]